MDYFKRFIINLFVLIGLLAIVYFAMPGIVGLVYQTIGKLFGPLVILLVIGAALPFRRKKSHTSKTKNPAGNVAGESTSKLADKRYLKLIAFVLIGLGIIVLIGVMINNSKALGIGGIGILILLILLKLSSASFLKQVDKKGKEVTRARRGAEAEKRIVEIFTNKTDQYFVINDVLSHFGNIDHVILKKDAGVFLIETKSHHGKVSFVDKSILINDHPTEKDFIAQTINNAYWLRNMLNPIVNCNVWIFPIIVFTNAFVPFAPPIKGIHIVNSKFLIGTLEKINNENPVNPIIWEQRETIFKTLKGNEKSQ